MSAIDHELFEQSEKMRNIRHQDILNDISPLMQLLIKRKEFCRTFDDRNSPHIHDIVENKKLYDLNIKLILNI